MGCDAAKRHRLELCDRVSGQRACTMMHAVAAQPTVLAINAGSASVKSALFTFEAHPRQLQRAATESGATSHVQDLLLAANGPADTQLTAIGHRIVHGGPDHYAPQQITETFLEQLEQLVPFAPNHLPAAIALVKALRQARPELPQIACFDTAFHHDLPEVARRLPIPRSYDENGVRRYGFHGLSYAYLLQELRRRAGRETANGALVLAHLGNGSSVAAVREGRSVDTSMCFTPLGGVIMSTRSGDLDPGLVTYIARSGGLTPDQVEDLLSHKAGLLAISGSTGDMRELLDRERTDAACRLAVDMYAYQVKKWIGAFAAVLGGVDTLVFSGGIGEHAPEVRRRICDGLQFLGVRIDQQRNASNSDIISTSDAPVVVRVIPTDEELMIAQAAYEVLS
jgi:acetate kinase